MYPQVGTLFSETTNRSTMNANRREKLDAHLKRAAAILDVMARHPKLDAEFMVDVETASRHGKKQEKRDYEVKLAKLVAYLSRVEETANRIRDGLE